MKKTQKIKWITLTTLLISIIGNTYGQLAPETYFVKFTDKANSPFSVSNPSAFLSQRAIDRRTQQNIAITDEDLPVNPSYIDSVLNLGNISLKYPLKWFNGIVIQSTDTLAIQQIWNLSFVDATNSVMKKGSWKAGFNKEIEEPVYPIDPDFSATRSATAFDYGAAEVQNKMINVHPLHDAGYTGQGKLIAVFDAGFSGVDTLLAFQHLWNNNKIIGTWDFVLGSDLQYNRSNHGMQVLSTMAANLPGLMIGTAPDADYILIRSENGFSELIIEEYNWVAGAEYADSLGADVFNTSLGYTTFNDPSHDHTYEDMNGDNTPITRGADIAASKGILVVNSAGNSGNSPWFYVGAPADGDSVLAIGAVGADRVITGFSSRGPSFDGRVKPAVCAQGAATTVYAQGDTVVQSNGTSFSGPVMAGAAACLWQSIPGYSNMDVYNAIQESADRYSSPNAEYGYGIPNMFIASALATGIEDVNISTQNRIYPNPTNGQFSIVKPDLDSDSFSIQVTDINGRNIEFQHTSSANNMIIDASDWEDGIYLIHIFNDAKNYTEKLVKF